MCRGQSRDVGFCLSVKPTVTASEPIGQLDGIGIRCVFPDEVATFEEFMTAMGQVLCEQFAVRRRNNGIIPAGKNQHGGRDAWQKRLKARKVARVGLDKFRGVREPAAGGGKPIVLENGVRRRDSRGLRDELHGDLIMLRSVL